MIGRVAMGIQAPIIRQGDDLNKIVIDSILRSTDLQDGDIIGITESVVARAQGNYVTVDEIAAETDRIFGKNAIISLVYPIYSRNRFSMILKGIARSAKRLYIEMPPEDEVGNPEGKNPWTGVNITEYYREICRQEHCECYINYLYPILEAVQFLDCRLRPLPKTKRLGVKTHNLKDYFPDKCGWGLLGSNKANEETLKLFPNNIKAQKLVEDIQKQILDKLNVKVEVMVYGDGCFKDPVCGIWEFADPVTSPAYTKGLEGSPNEIKLKAFADDKYKDLSGQELTEAIKAEIRNKKASLKGNMSAQGTTPRRYIDLLASLMDLTSGSGDAGTPIVLVRNYFKNYSNA